MIILKLGGSLIHSAKRIIKDLIEYTSSTGETILIVPGGSIFADTVRKANPSDEAAHWMAILAMEQYGYYLADGTDAKLIDNLKIPGNGTYVLLPYNLLKSNDELSHTWDVTSDTIAAWIALKLRARCIKVTDVDGIYLNGTLQNEIKAEELVGIETCVDAELPHFLMKNNMNCEIINGNCPGRVLNALKGNITGTFIKG
ncbi:5-(aminomethyl)-3-furanmethanol phosphate kinase [Methanosarcinales archaeon]|nr:5-(aminomethyl)-3-furanmethanol phosphate kinase [Methanosarcinales archaeon]